MTTLVAATGNDVVRLTEHNGVWSVTQLLSDVGVQCVAVDPHDAQRLYAGTFDRGLFRSADGGETWAPAGDGIPHGRVLSVSVSPSSLDRGCWPARSHRSCADLLLLQNAASRDSLYN